MIDDLYGLLPAIYRERDEELGGPLKALLSIVQEQSDLVEQDIRQLWDDFFVETCEPWAIPYLGDLVANLPLFDASRVHQPDTAGELFPDLTGPRLAPEVALRSRADVAKTIYYRRRKGTLPMLEELARDVTGWGAHAVEFFELLGWTQCVRNHLRMHSPRTPDLRRVEPVDRLNGPFDTTSHTVDVRPIEALTGWYNIKNIGFFLWRLRSHEVENVPARRVGAAGDYRYHFSPLGNPAPLFTRWRREGDEAGLATELHVPGPIRPAAFYEDLQRYRALPPPGPGFTDFYGLFDALPGPGLPQAPHSSLMIFRNGVPVPPDRILSKDLGVWSRPQAGFRGARSGPLAPFPAITAANPELAVTLAGVGPHTVPLGGVPATLDEARGLLEAAIRSRPEPEFRAARIVAVDDHLLIIPGTSDSTVSFGATPGDATTVNELRLDAGSLETVQGVLSARLHPFPRITNAAPAVAVTLGPDTAGAALGSRPANLADARSLLETAIRGAGAGTRFTAARVVALADRLLVLSGNPSEAVRFDRTAGDATTAADLGLLDLVGIDPKRGRIVFPLGWEPTAVDVWYHSGFSADLGGGSYPRRAWLVRRSDHKVYKVTKTGAGGADTTVGAALLKWAADGKPNAVISILDSRTYEEAVTIEPADDPDPEKSRWIAIEAADEVRPHLQLTAPLEIQGNHPKSAVTLSGLLIEGRVHVTGELGRLRLLHTTLVPGRALEPDEGRPAGNGPSLEVDGGAAPNLLNEELRVEIAFSITGPLRIPEHVLGVWILDGIVDGVGTPALAGPGATGGPDDPDGPPAWLERVTLFGSSRVRELPLATEVIFTGPVLSRRRQAGCVRFSFVPAASKTPRRYRCQPDLEIALRTEEAERKKGSKLTPLESKKLRDEVRGWLVPSFTSDRYGQPAYAQLHLACPRQITTGAEDGSEMGAFCHLKQPQREANLRLRLEEYLPFGLEPGILYVT